MRPTEHPALRCEPHRIATRREDDRAVRVTRDRRPQANVPGERADEPLGLETLPGRERGSRLLPHAGRPPGLEPREGLSETPPEQPLELGVAAGALRAEGVEAAMAPDHAA